MLVKDGKVVSGSLLLFGEAFSAFAENGYKSENMLTSAFHSI